MLFEIQSTPLVTVVHAAGCTCSCPCGACNCKTNPTLAGQVGRSVAIASGEAGGEAVDPVKLALNLLTF